MKRRADTPFEAAFRLEARSWLEAHAKRKNGVDDWSGGPRVHTVEAEDAYWDKMKAWARTRFDGGWAAITWPRAFGGRGASPVEALIFAEEASAFDVSCGFIDAAVGLIGPALIKYGTPEQQARFLGPMLRADEIWCQLFSEPEAGSDLAAVRTRAVVEGDHLVINGQKVWTTSAQYADWGFIVCRTDPDVPKHDGITFAMVDMRQPGVEVRPLVTMKGDRHFNEVFFKDVRTPLSYVINGLNRGWPVTTFVLMNEGASIGTTSHGRHRVEDLVADAVASGRIDDAVVRERLGAGYVEERVLGLLQDRLRSAILDGRRPDVDGSVLKVFTAESGHRKAELAAWLQGPAALLAGHAAPMDGRWQDGLLGRGAMTVGGGTVEVHRNGLGERALGLPKEPRLDRDRAFKDLRVSS